MIALTRYVVDRAQAPEFLDDARAALAVLGEQSGFLGGEVGRATDDPALWTLTTRWQGVGAYRRALSSYDVRLRAVPLLARCLDEPTAYEVLARHDEAGTGSARAADAATVAVGEASAPWVPTDLDRRPGDGPAQE